MWEQLLKVFHHCSGAVLISMAQYGDTGDGCEILHQLIDGKHPLIIPK